MKTIPRQIVASIFANTEKGVTYSCPLSASFKKACLFLTVAMFYLSYICTGQQYKYIYYFDAQLASVPAAEAVVKGKGLKEDGVFRLDYFGQNGKLFLSAHYLDSTLATLQGQLTLFHPNGKLEAQGDYLNNQKTGIWQKWDSLGFKNDSTIYQDDNAIKVGKFGYHKEGTLSFFSFKDSLADTFMSAFYDEKGTISREVFFNGQTGIMKTYDSGTVKLDSLFTRDEREASFAGGNAAWAKYLQKNLNANIPVQNRAPRGVYQVIVKFIVNKDGRISDIRAETNYGYGMEKEVIRILKKGPDWEPAVQYGRKVNAYRRQPITFVVEEQ